MSSTSKDASALAEEDSSPEKSDDNKEPASRKAPEQKAGLMRRLYDWCLKWAGTPYAVPALMTMSFAEASFFPIPPDILLLAMCFSTPKKSFKFAFYCLVGSVLGGMLGYYIGYALWGSVSHFFIPRIFSQAAFDKVSQLYVDNAFLVIVAKGFTPIPFKVVTISAGVAKVNFAQFVAASIICRSIRFFLVAGLIYFFGERVRPFIEKYLTPLLLLAFVLLVGGIAAVKLFRLASPPMSETAHVQDSAAEHERASYFWSRMGSLLAFAPLGVWTFFHVFANMASLQGAEAWQASVTAHSHPASLVATTTIVMLPIVIHTIWGIKRLASSRPNNQRYGFFNNLRYVLQRASAVGVLLFLGAHIWLAFLNPRLTTGNPETFKDISYEMAHHMPTLIVYVLGTLGVSYHLGNGIQGFCMSWGIATTRDGLKHVERISYVAFIVLYAMSLAAIYGLYRAGSALPVVAGH